MLHAHPARNGPKLSDSLVNKCAELTPQIDIRRQGECDGSRCVAVSEMSACRCLQYAHVPGYSAFILWRDYPPVAYAQLRRRALQVR